MLISDVRDEIGSVRDLLRDSLNPDIGRNSADAIIAAAKERLDTLHSTLDSECDRPDDAKAADAAPKRKRVRRAISPDEPFDMAKPGRKPVLRKCEDCACCDVGQSFCPKLRAQVKLDKEHPCPAFEKIGAIDIGN